MRDLLSAMFVSGAVALGIVVLVGGGTAGIQTPLAAPAAGVTAVPASSSFAEGEAEPAPLSVRVFRPARVHGGVAEAVLPLSFDEVPGLGHPPVEHRVHTRKPPVAAPAVTAAPAAPAPPPPAPVAAAPAPVVKKNGKAPHPPKTEPATAAAAAPEPAPTTTTTAVAGDQAAKKAKHKSH